MYQDKFDLPWKTTNKLVIVKEQRVDGSYIGN
jgi:hypothetical protein